MSVLTFLSILSLVLSLIGNILVNYKQRFGFIVWISSNFSWIAVNLIGEPNWSQVIMFVIYAVLNIQGFIIWSRKKQ